MPSPTSKLNVLFQTMKSNLDLVNDCDNFPYYQDDPTLYARHVSTYYHLRVSSSSTSSTLGYIRPSVAEVLRGLTAWQLDDAAVPRTLTLLHGDNEEERSKVVAATTAAMRETGHFKVLEGWRNELYPVYDYGEEGKRQVVFKIERAASPLFGVVTYGSHLTAYVRSKRKRSEEAEVWSGERQDETEDEMKIWVPRRASTKQTYGGMLDNTVAGGIATGESPLESVIREASEEASFPEQLVRERAKAVGAVTYFHIRDERAGGETGLLQPECQYVYDLELDKELVPKPSDDEVEEFSLMTVEEVRNALAKGDFKPNSAIVLLDFFVRHGILSTENEDDYIEIVARLHRRLEFPTA